MKMATKSTSPTSTSTNLHSAFTASTFGCDDGIHYPEILTSTMLPESAYHIGLPSLTNTERKPLNLDQLAPFANHGHSKLHQYDATAAPMQTHTHHPPFYPTMSYPQPYNSNSNSNMLETQSCLLKKLELSVYEKRCDNNHNHKRIHYKLRIDHCSDDRDDKLSTSLCEFDNVLLSKQKAGHQFIEHEFTDGSEMERRCVLIHEYLSDLLSTGYRCAERDGMLMPNIDTKLAVDVDKKCVERDQHSQLPHSQQPPPRKKRRLTAAKEACADWRAYAKKIKLQTTEALKRDFFRQSKALQSALRTDNKRCKQCGSRLSGEYGGGAWYPASTRDSHDGDDDAVVCEQCHRDKVVGCAPRNNQNDHEKVIIHNIISREEKQLQLRDDAENDCEGAEKEENEMDDKRNEKEHEVENIEGEKVAPDGTHFYLVKWKDHNYDACTWEPQLSLVNAPLMLNAWRRRVQRNKNKFCEHTEGDYRVMPCFAIECSVLNPYRHNIGLKDLRKHGILY